MTDDGHQRKRNFDARITHTFSLDPTLYNWDHSTDKFGQIRETSGKPVRYDTTRAGVREQLFASLERLGTDYIDVYLPARITPETPIEETVAALKELVEEGKIRYVGLSEANAETIRR